MGGVPTLNPLCPLASAELDGRPAEFFLEWGLLLLLPAATGGAPEGTTLVSMIILLELVVWVGEGVLPGVSTVSRPREPCAMGGSVFCDTGRLLVDAWLWMPLSLEEGDSDSLPLRCFCLLGLLGLRLWKKEERAPSRPPPRSRSW